ncbi:MAG: AEC family transporter [Oscillospiraceae bacterium]|nr:AEC family transporter [Oscillospiraceae bacterium]
MESLLMAVQVVVPMAIMVCIGVIMRICKVADAATMKKVDNMIFKVFMPTLSFYNIHKTDFSKLNTIGYILYGVAVLMVLFLIAMTVVPKYVKPRPTAASYGQAIFRSNYLIFGAAVAESVYGAGNIGIVSLLGAVAVPLFNAQAAILLETARQGTASTKKLLLAIAKNPTVIATVMGLAVNFSGIVLPELVLGVVEDLSGLTTPLSFLSIGVSLSLGAVSKKGYLTSGILLRLVLIPLVFVAIAVLLGFRGQELCALLILFAAPTAVSSYPMAVAMDADGDFAAQMVAYTTVFCLPTIFLWTLLLNSMHML